MCIRDRIGGDVERPRSPGGRGGLRLCGQPGDPRGQLRQGRLVRHVDPQRERRTVGADESQQQPVGLRPVGEQGDEGGEQPRGAEARGDTVRQDEGVTARRAGAAALGPRPVGGRLEGAQPGEGVVRSGPGGPAGQRGEREVRVLRHGPQQVDPGAGEVRDRAPVEQVGAVLDHHVQVVGAGAFADDHRQVELGRPRRQSREERAALLVDGRAEQALAEDEVRRQGLVDVHDVEDRVAGRIAVGRDLADDGVEGDLLVLQALDDVGAHPPQQCVEPGVARQVRPQRDGVVEEAEQAPQLGAGASDGGGADHDVVLAGPPGQRHAEAGEQYREESGGLRDPERAEPVDERGRESETVRGACVVLPRGARAVGGQRQYRGVGEPFPPVPQLAFEESPVHQFALPVGVVAVLDGQRLEPVLAPLAAGLVELRQLAHQDLRGPAVVDGVVGQPAEQVVVGGEPDQGDPDQWVVFHVEGAL